MNVRELMTTKVHCCRPDSTARHALALMWKHDVGALPVVDAQDQVVGMITDRDIAMAVGLRNVAPGAITVREISTSDVWAVGPTATAEEAERIMEERQVRRLPVIDQGRLVGVVTLADLARCEPLPDRDVAETLAAITTPREVEPV
jgi:CBS domain-containing protein